VYFLNKFTQAAYKNYPILYLACHGGEGWISISDRQTYSLQDLSPFLRCRHKKPIIIIGSCSTLDIDKRYIKTFLQETGAIAVCGYKNDVDWMRSAAFELLLLSELQYNTFDGRGIKAIERRYKELAKSFRIPNKENNIDFRMVSLLDLS